MELWTSAHAATVLPALIVMIGIAVALRIGLGKKPLKVRMIPFQVLACILVALEIGKQIVSLSDGYDPYHLPFHFCSLFIFALPVMAFYKGKHKQTVYGITAALCSAVFLLMLIYPNIIYSGDNIRSFFSEYLSFHTVAFHNIVMFEFILIVALELHTPAKNGELNAVVLFTLCFCGVAALMAQLLKTNFANFYTCNIPVFEALRTKVQGVIGGGMTQLLYVLTVSAAHLIFVSIAYWFYRLLRHITSKIGSQVQMIR